jgi:hypothetical protein
MVEMLAVGAIEWLAVLQALEYHEGRVEKRYGEQDQRQHKRHYGLGLDSSLDGDDAHQQAQQLRAAVTHEARRGREVVKQEAERRPGGQRRQHSRLLTVQVKGDDRHRGGDDRAHARRQPVDAVGEVDDVHHHHKSNHGDDRSRVGEARVRERERAGERQRNRLHRNAEVHHDHRCQHLPEQLDRRVQVKAVVEHANTRDHGGGQQYAVPQLRLLFARVTSGQPHQAGDQRPGEDRKTTQQRRRPLGQAPLARFVDRPDHPGETHRQRCQQRGDDRGGQKGVKRVELVWMRHRLLQSIAGREVDGYADGYTCAVTGRLSYSG